MPDQRHGAGEAAGVDEATGRRGGGRQHRIDRLRPGGQEQPLPASNQRNGDLLDPARTFRPVA